jgi:hypothetical protein
MLPFSPSGTAVNTPRLSFSSEHGGTSKTRTRGDGTLTSSPSKPDALPDSSDRRNTYDEERASLAATALAPEGPVHVARVQMEHELEGKNDWIVKFQEKNDPLDPRNQPTWKKLALFLTIALNAFLVR